MRHNDCFAYHEKKLLNGEMLIMCEATNYEDCKGCKFYKTVKEQRKQLLKINGTADMKKILLRYKEEHAGGMNER